MESGQGISLLIVAVAAALLPGLSKRLHMPSPAAEILTGVVLGTSVLNMDIGEHWLPFLAEMGFLLLMFQAGMEIDFTLLRKQGTKRLSFQALLFGATFILAIIAAALLKQDMFIALVLSTTSLGLVMPVLKESELTGTPFGQTVLVAATLADFLTLLGITFYVLWQQDGPFHHFLIPLAAFAGFGAMLRWARLWAWWNPERAERLLLADSVQEQGVRISLALLFLFVALSELTGLEPALGAFMGGCIISFVFREKKPLESKISVLGFGFLIPMFFIHTGMEFNVQNILSADRIAFTAWLICAAALVKLLPCLLFPLRRMKLFDGLRAGTLLSSRLSLIIAAASIGLQEGFITAGVKDSIIFLALATCLAGPIAFQALNRLRPLPVDPKRPVRPS